MPKVKKEEWIRVRVEKELKDRFTLVVEASHESESYNVREALREYVARWEDEKKRAQETDARFPNSSPVHNYGSLSDSQPKHTGRKK